MDGGVKTPAGGETSLARRGRSTVNNGTGKTSWIKKRNSDLQNGNLGFTDLELAGIERALADKPRSSTAEAHRNEQKEPVKNQPNTPL